MRRLDKLITLARRESENSGDVSSTAGIPDDEFVQWANEGQEFLQNKVETIDHDIFAAEDFIDVVANQEAYEIDRRSMLKANIISCEFSYTGQAPDCVKLRRMTFQERDTSTIPLNPTHYIMRSGYILLNPIPTTSVTNGIRIVYAKKVDRIDRRRAVVDAVVLATNAITSLSLDVASTDPVFIAADVTVDDYICIVDRNGVVKMRNIPISAVNSTTGDVTVVPGFTFGVGETISVGDYVVAGKDTTTHSEFADNCEHFLVQWMVFKAFKRDSSDDAIGKEKEIEGIWQAIIGQYADENNDVEYIPILNRRYFNAF